MDKLFPLPNQSPMRDDDWFASLQSQFEGTIPAVHRDDLLNKWMQAYMPGYTFDENEADKKCIYLDPDDFEMHMSEEMGISYSLMKSKLLYLFSQYYSILFSEENETPFVELYYAYLYFVVQINRAIAHFIRYVVEIETPSGSDPIDNVKHFFDSFLKNDKKEEPVSILDPMNMDSSLNYKSISIVLQAKSLGDFIEGVALDDSVTILSDYIFNMWMNEHISNDEDDKDKFMRRIYYDIQDSEARTDILKFIETE